MIDSKRLADIWEAHCYPDRLNNPANAALHAVRDETRNDTIEEIDAIALIATALCPVGKGEQFEAGWSSALSEIRRAISVKESPRGK